MTPPPTAPAAILAPQQARQRQSQRDLVITGLALVALLVWDGTGADMALVRLFGTPSGFPWRDAWLTRDLAHAGGRALAWVVLGVLVLDALRPLVAGPSRRQRGFGLLLVLISLLLIPTLKRFSLTSCPWDLLEFGGLAAQVSHWRIGVADGGPGHCFPSGHAVAAFAFFGIYFAWRDTRPALARAVLVLVITVGVVFGWAQMARGAHFASHTMWSAWLCWSVGVLATLLANERARRAAPLAATSPPGVSP